MKKIIYMVATVVLISVISIGLFEFYQNWRNDRTEDRVNNPFRESDAEDLNKVSGKKGKVKDFTTAELKYGATMLEYLKLIESEQAELDDLFIFIQESPEVLENRNLTDELAMMVGTIDSLVSEVSNLERPSDDVARISHSIIEYVKIRKELTELYYNIFGYYEEVEARKIIELEELSSDLLEKYKKKATLLFDASSSYDGPLDEPSTALDPNGTLFLNPTTKKIMLNGIYLDMHKDEVVEKLGIPDIEDYDYEYDGELFQEYKNTNISYYGEIVRSVVTEISEEDFLNDVFPYFEGRKFTDEVGTYVAYSEESNELALYKDEMGASLIYLTKSDGNFDNLVEEGYYVEIK